MENMHGYYVALCLTAEHLNPDHFPGTCAAYKEVIKIEQYIQNEFDALKRTGNAPTLEPANVITPAPLKQTQSCD